MGSAVAVGKELVARSFGVGSQMAMGLVVAMGLGSVMAVGLVVAMGMGWSQWWLWGWGR